MLSNCYTFRLVASTLDSTLQSLQLSSIFTQQKDELILVFEGGRHCLVITCTPSAATCYLQDGLRRAKRNSVDLMPECLGTAVRSVEAHPSDRIIHIVLSAGTPGGNLTIVAQFFGPKSNILVVDDAFRIVTAFKHAKELVGSVYPEEPEEAMPDFALLRTRLAAQDPPGLPQVLREVFPQLGTTLIREAIFRAGLQSPILPLNSGDFERLLHALRSIFQELTTPVPRLYLGPAGTPEIFSLIPLAHAGDREERKFDDVHEAIRTYLFRRASAAHADDRRTRVVAALRRQTGKMHRSRAAIAEDLQNSSRAADYERFASFLMSGLEVLPRGAREGSLPDGTRIPLEPRLSQVQNAQHYFEKAKRARTAEEQSRSRLSAIERELQSAEALLSALETAPSEESFEEILRDHQDELKDISPRGATEEAPPFRRFVVDGGFEVWAGKSSANNDLLTLKHTRPDDLWFHVRGSGGSHVVLKVRSGKGEPSKKAREQAAGIAAYYSGMKNARMVPVAMTRRKYVRKPKGAPPGSVTIEREKVIFAEPALPELPRRTRGGTDRSPRSV